MPHLLTTMNDGLATIQFQSVSLHPDDPTTDAMGGTQDNGTWLFSGGPEWLETIDGDGGQSGYGRRIRRSASTRTSTRRRT